MEDNLARELEVDLEEQTVAWEQAYAQPLEKPYEKSVPSIEPIPQGEPVPKGLSKFERFLITAIGIVVFGLVLLNIQSNLEMATASRSVQDVNVQIAQTEIEIENLQQQTHELSRYDRINAIAQKFGLELHEENIVNIAPQE